MRISLRSSLVFLATLVATASIVAVAFVPAASATVMVEVPLEEMIVRADVIVHGTVRATQVQMHMREGGLEPQTVTTIEVHEWLGGTPAGTTVQLRELGGVWQGGGLHFEGTPEYHVGDEVVVFLERRPEAPHDLRTFAMVQGQFLVQHGVPGVPSSVRRDLSGIAFARWAEGRQVVSAPGQEPAMELGTFLDFVRRVRGGQP